MTNKDRLENVIGKYVIINKSGPFKYSMNSLKQVPFDSEIVDIIGKMIKGNEELDFVYGVIEGLVEGRLEELKRFRKLLPEIENSIFCKTSQVSLNAPLSILWNSNYQGLKKIVLKLLETERVSKVLFGIVVASGDIEFIPSLIKCQDNPVAEEAAMGGILRFIYRDMAFVAIEKLSGNHFVKKDAVGIAEGVKCYYYDWKPVLMWWENRVHKKTWNVFNVFRN